MASDIDKVKDFNDRYEHGFDFWQPYYMQADVDQSYYLGKQWSNANLDYLKRQNREAYVFNEIARTVKQISGHQRRNRTQAMTIPGGDEDQEISDTINKVLDYAFDRCGGYNIISDGFEQGALITGINLVSTYIDTTKDKINGDIEYNRIPYNAFMLDPAFSSIDLKDCSYILRRRYVDNNTAAMLLPEFKNDLMDMEPATSGDDKFQYMTQSRNNKGRNNLLRYDEYWERTTKQGYILVDRYNQEIKTLKEATTDYIKWVKKTYPMIDVKKIDIPTVRLNIMVEGELFYSEKAPYKVDDYPFTPIIGIYTPEYYDYGYKMQGIVRKLRDSQEELNKMVSKSSDIMKSQLNSGWEVEENQVVNPNSLYETGQGIVIERRKGTPPLNRLTAPEISQTYPIMIQNMQRNIIELAGGSQELFGVSSAGNSQVSGTLSKQRAGNALTAFQDLFDNCSLSQKLIAEKTIDLALANFSIAKINQICDTQFPEDMELDKDKILSFDIDVVEGTQTNNQKELMFLQLLELRNAGINIPDKLMIKYAPIANKTDLISDFNEINEVEQQQEQEAKQLVQQQQELNIKLNNAKIVSDLSLGEERKARAKADIGLLQERMSESVQNRSQSVLDSVRAVAEIADIRQDSLIKAITFIQQMEKQAEEETSQATLVNTVIAEQEKPEQEFVALNQITQQPNQQ